MGTSIAATLAHLHGFHFLAEAFGVIAMVIAVVVISGWLRSRNPGFDPETMAPWGMLVMGLLALGSAWTAITGSVNFQLVSWGVCSPLAAAVCINQLRRFPGGSPSFQWALALVAPMVAATSAGQLSAHFSWLRPMGIALFVLTFFTAVPIFVRCYAAAWGGRMNLPANLGGTAWIPLGMVGQSAAASHVLFPTPLAHGYSATILAAGIPLAVYAAIRFWRGVFSWAGYTPGWWGSTFPVGTVSLGTHLFARSTGFAWLDAVSLGAFFLLVAHWLLCVARWGTWAAEAAPTRSRGAVGVGKQS